MLKAINLLVTYYEILISLRFMLLCDMFPVETSNWGIAYFIRLHCRGLCIQRF